MVHKHLDIKTLETWLWEAACAIRGDIDAPKYKDYILPLIFLKRLSDVFDDEIQKLSDKFGDRQTAEEFLKDDHKLVRFYLPDESRWESIAKQTPGIGEYLTKAMRLIARENSKLHGVIDMVDFNASTAGQRIISDNKLKALIQILGRYRLGLTDVEPDIVGRAYEYLLRKFAEGSGQSAGEFYTPREVAVLMAHILDPKSDEEIYDPCCGSGGLLIKCHLRFKETHPDTSIAPLRFYGQEVLHSTYAMALMNAFIHDMEAQIKLGDTMNLPAFLDNGKTLRKFDVVTANPMWNQNFPQDTYENDSFHRFPLGYPPSNTADWGWVQHMYASLDDNGRMAVVLDTGVVSRGSGNAGTNRERDIRKKFVEKDLVEAVILLPGNLFYNTTAPGVIVLINKNKAHQGQILLINASKLFHKGRPKNYLSDESIQQVYEIYTQWKDEEGISRAVTSQEALQNDANLSPSRYVAANDQEEVLPLEDAIVLVKEAEEERREAEKKLAGILKQIGIEL